MKRLLPTWVGAPRLDPVLMILLILIISFGLIVLYSASGQDMAVVNRQAIRLGFGLLVMLIISQVPPRVLRAWTPWLYGSGVAMLLATLVLGVGRGTQRWLDFGLFRFQPSELMKLAVPMMVAWYLHSRVLPPTGNQPPCIRNTAGSNLADLPATRSWYGAAGRCQRCIYPLPGGFAVAGAV